MIHKSLLILGRQPAIGRAEVESLLGSTHVQPLGDYAIACDLSAENVPFDRLGSSVKLAAFVGTINTTNIREAQADISQLGLACAQTISEGKVQLGISAYGLRTSPQQLVAVGLNLKKALRANGYSVRLVPNQAEELSSAQVLHNHLTGERGIELVLVRSGAHIVVGRTVAIQDIAAYAARDQHRPKRDARVGMLPPKLAQTIINLASAPLTLPEGQVAEAAGPRAQRLLDPFCGTGVILQEALLMGYDAYGTDVEPRMIDYSQANLAWLSERHGLGTSPELAVGDATNFAWQPPVDLVACETYLGQPLSAWPSDEKLRQIIGTCNVIIEKFLRNLVGQLKSGTRLCLAVPAWRAPAGRIHHLPLLDRLSEMGYNRVSFEYARREDLVYFRPDQLVARELVVITRK